MNKKIRKKAIPQVNFCLTWKKSNDVWIKETFKKLKESKISTRSFVKNNQLDNRPDLCFELLEKKVDCIIWQVLCQLKKPVAILYNNNVPQKHNQLMKIKAIGYY